MSLFSSLAVSGSGMSAQRTRAELLVENMANAETTRTPDGGPYRRKDAVFESEQVSSPFAAMLDEQMGVSSATATGVHVSQIMVDERDPEKRYLPGHPDADKDGYVSYPRINPAEDMTDLVDTSRNYGANVSAIAAVKDMIQQSIGILA